MGVIHLVGQTGRESHTPRGSDMAWGSHTAWVRRGVGVIHRVGQTGCGGHTPCGSDRVWG